MKTKTKPEAVASRTKKIFSFQKGDIKKLYTAIESELTDHQDQEIKKLKIRIGKIIHTYRHEHNLTMQEFCENTGIEVTSLILAERGLLCDEELTDTLSAIDVELETSFEAVFRELKAIEMDL